MPPWILTQVVDDHKQLHRCLILTFEVISTQIATSLDVEIDSFVRYAKEPDVVVFGNFEKLLTIA